MSVDFSYANVSHHPLLKPMALAALWRHKTAKAIRQWQQYLDDQGLVNPAISEQLAYALEQLTKIRYTIAVVAEVSRGKSELINAMLFAQHGKRIVPSGAGRTTMCPTEFFCDEDVSPYLELLPIETRTQSTSFTQLSNTPSAWQRFDLNGEDTEVLTLALQKMCAKQKVTLDQAQALGFELDSFDNEGSGAVFDEQDANTAVVEIPMWRYARLNIHHPLLATGLAILDTPGLNVLGHEPELTHAILPTVDSVIYLLAADVGVSRSDQLAWQTHLSHLPEHSKLGVLNKVDSLSDGLRSTLEMSVDIVRQMDHCAQALGLPKSQVFAISARQALIARTQQDDQLLAQSRLPQLEQSLTTQLLEKRQVLLKSYALRALSLSHQDASQQLQSLTLQTQTQLTELNSLSTSRDPQQMMLAYAAETKKRYTLESALSLATQQTMNKQWAMVSSDLATHPIQQVFDVLISSCHTASTSALKQQLNTTLVTIHTRLSDALLESQKAMAFAHKTLGKVHQLNHTPTNGTAEQATQLGMVQSMVDDAQAQAMMGEYLNELSRMGQTSSTYLPALPFLSATQRIKAVQTMLALQQRCELMMVDSKRYAKRWFEQMNHALGSALNLHRALLNKRADTLERMHQAQQALTQNVSSQGNALESLNAQMSDLTNRYQQAMAAVSTENQSLQPSQQTPFNEQVGNRSPAAALRGSQAAMPIESKPLASLSALKHLVLTPR
jgi:Dynamin family